QASLTAGDIEKLVRFEVLSYGQEAQPVKGGRRRGSPSKVHWDLLERRIASNEKAYQRQIIPRKIDDPVQYSEQWRQARDVRALNERDDSALAGGIKLLGVGAGRVARAPVAQELKKSFAAAAFGSRHGDAFYDDMKKFFVNYFKQIAQVFGGAWNGRKYSIKSATALRTFIRVAPDVVRRLDQEHAERGDFRAIGRVIAPRGRRFGDLRCANERQWKRSGRQ